MLSWMSWILPSMVGFFWHTMCKSMFKTTWVNSITKMSVSVLTTTTGLLEPANDRMGLLGLVSVDLVNRDCCFRLPDWSTCWAYRLVSLTICSITSLSQNNSKKVYSFVHFIRNTALNRLRFDPLKVFWSSWTLCHSFNWVHTNFVASAVWSKSLWFVLSSESVCWN